MEEGQASMMMRMLPADMGAKGFARTSVPSGRGSIGGIHNRIWMSGLLFEDEEVF